MPTLDILAVAAHRDDVEQTCGGTLLRMKAVGLHTGILDLTQGEAGTRGSALDRAAEAAEAARLLRVDSREALDIPDGRVENTYENRIKIVGVLRRLRPPGSLSFPTGPAAIPTTTPPRHLVTKLAFSPAWQSSTPGRRRTGHSRSSMPACTRTCVPASMPQADISEHIEARFTALMAYRSQYTNQNSGSGLFVPEEEIRERTFAMARHYGLLAGVRYAEPFVQKEIGLVDDLTLVPVQSL